MDSNLSNRLLGLLGEIQQAFEELAGYLAMWAHRRPIPEGDRPARAAADQAVERVDAALRGLIVLRSQLVAEVAVEDAAWLRLDDDQVDDVDGGGRGER